MSLLFGMFGRIGSFLTGFGDLKKYEKYKQKIELNERKYIGALILYSILLYIIIAIIYYIYLMPRNVIDRVKTIIPFLVTPLIIYFIRRFLKWLYIKRATYCEKKLNDLKEERKNILEEVKEKETYKKAREILERFGADIKLTPPSTPLGNTSVVFSQTPYVNRPNPNDTSILNNTRVGLNNTLVHRNVKNIQQQHTGINNKPPASSNMLNSTQPIPNRASQASISNNLSNTSLSVSMNNSNNNSSGSGSGSGSQSNLLSQTQPLQQNPAQHQPPPSSLAIGQTRTLLPRPIIAPNRTIFDKLLDFIIGEGPNNRYALICKSCHFHNGMALKEEFEFIAFRCAYCLFYNEARKTKLAVPKLNNQNGTANLNESRASSTLSLSNSFDDLGTVSEPLSTSSTAPPQPTNSSGTILQELKPNKSETNLNAIKGDLHRRVSLTDSTNLSTINSNLKKSSRSVEMINNERINDDESKENDITNDIENEDDKFEQEDDEQVETN